MTTYTGAWSRAEVAAFLEAATIPLRLACRTPAGRPWMLSLWFRFDGRFHRATGAGADVVEHLEADPEVAFEVSTNDPPYRGVRGRGEATIEPDDRKDLLGELLLGPHRPDERGVNLRHGRHSTAITSVRGYRRTCETSRGNGAIRSECGRPARVGAPRTPTGGRSLATATPTPTST
jgi:nitroimidazol reductase NimA-like FMN-containing flavoprotein (pyridoxamine 5'-phosphate oxidase superfamily)